MSPIHHRAALGQTTPLSQYYYSFSPHFKPLLEFKLYFADFHKLGRNKKKNPQTVAEIVQT